MNGEWISDIADLRMSFSFRVGRLFRLAFISGSSGTVAK